MGKTIVAYAKFLRDVACQKLLNSANVSQSYSKNNTGTVFLRHGVYSASHYKITSNAAKENCFQEPFKTNETVRISKFIWQRVPDCWAGIVECLTAIQAESTPRHSACDNTHIFALCYVMYGKVMSWY